MLTPRDHALAYLDLGWSIIPVTPGRKKPNVLWTEYQTRPPSRDEVLRWWARWPDANVGIVTGRVSGLVVIDVDVQHGGSVESAYAEAETKMIVRSASGGYHLYYAYPEGVESVGNRVGLKPGIDLRGDGGFVVAPPSVAGGGEYSWVSRGEPAPFPQHWLKQLDPADVSNHEPQADWVTEMLAGVGEGGRNDAAARLAGYLYGKNLPLDILSSMMTLWNQRNSPPLPAEELQRTIVSISSRPRRVAPVPVAAVTDRPTFGIMSMQDYMATYGGSEIKWLVDTWFPESTIGFAVSPPGTFKTWLLFDLALSVASGTPFLGQFPVARKGPVLIIQQEDFHGQNAERLATALYAREPFGALGDSESDFEARLPRALPIYFHPDRQLRFDNLAVMDELENVIRELRPLLVIIDPLYSAASTDDYMASAAGKMFRLKEFRDRYGTAFLIAHHTRKVSREKSDSGGSQREDAWGSQFLNAFLETGWQVRPAEGNSVHIRRHFKASQNVAEVELEFDISTVDPVRYEVRVMGLVGTSVADLVRSNPGIGIADLSDKSGLPLTSVWAEVAVGASLRRYEFDSATGRVFPSLAHLDGEGHSE